jgi:hypothetical protein
MADLNHGVELVGSGPQCSALFGAEFGHGPAVMPPG